MKPEDHGFVFEPTMDSRWLPALEDEEYSIADRELATVVAALVEREQIPSTLEPFLVEHYDLLLGVENYGNELCAPMDVAVVYPKSYGLAGPHLKGKITFFDVLDEYLRWKAEVRGIGLYDVRQMERYPLANAHKLLHVRPVVAIRRSLETELRMLAREFYMAAVRNGAELEIEPYSEPLGRLLRNYSRTLWRRHTSITEAAFWLSGVFTRGEWLYWMPENELPAFIARHVRSFGEREALCSHAQDILFAVRHGRIPRYWR